MGSNGFMDPPHSLPDKTNKKVSRGPYKPLPSSTRLASKPIACNTCRLKRKKCNGLDPCLFCTENRIECSYSREPRRRGPPSGYLRYTETRVALFEIMLGLFVSRISPAPEASNGGGVGNSGSDDSSNDTNNDSSNTIDPLYEVVQTLLAESKSCTQDVWDGHRRVWTVCRSAKIIDELAISFAPYSQRPDQEVASRPLLRSSVHHQHHPNAGPGSCTTAAAAAAAATTTTTATATATSGATYASARTPDTPVPPSPCSPSSRDRPALGPSSSIPWAAGPTPAIAPLSLPPLDSSTPGLDHGALEFASCAVPRLSRESFERCSVPPLQPTTQHPEPTESPVWQYPQLGSAEYGASSETKQGRMTPSTVFSLDLSIEMDHENSAAVTAVGQENPNLLPSPINGNSIVVGQLGDQDTNYNGSYWRSVDLAMPDSPSAINFTSWPVNPALPPPATSLELPPRRILSKMIDVYYNNVWSTFPFLPTRPTIESLLSSVPIQSEAFTTVLLALCAYCGHLSPPSEDSIGVGDASKVAADLWYEQARSGVFSCIRKGCSVELVQALLLLALNDHGKGNETQAWIFVGIAVRAGQDMDLNGDLPTTYMKKNFPPEEIRLRRNIWSVSLMLDLFLSLQLGRPPASFDCLRSALNDTHESEYTNHPVPIFLYAVALCRTISRINLHLYLGYNTPDMQTQTEKLNKLRDELETWYQFLPTQYRAVIGHQADRAVLELNMLYHVAVILLHRPFVREHIVEHAMDSLAEAATAFHGLLEKYRQIQNESLVSSNPPLSLSNPNMIYIIFSVAIAHLSGYKMRHPQAKSPKTMAVALHQTQLRLLNCLEALTSIGATWQLARRLWKTLDKLIEVEGLKPQRNATRPSELSPQSLGKRKREDDDMTRDVQRSFPDTGARELVPGVHIINPDVDQPPALSGFERTLGSSSTKSLAGSTAQTQQRSSDPPELTGWEDSAASTITAPVFTTLSIPAHALPSELFSSTEFSSVRWLSESSPQQENDSVSLDMVWNGFNSQLV